MQTNASWKTCHPSETHASSAQLHGCHQPVNLWQKCDQSHSECQCKKFLEVLTAFLLMSTLVLLHEKFGRSTSEWVKGSTEKESWDNGNRRSNN